MKTPWKNGVYASNVNRATYLKIENQTVSMYTPAILDFPDTNPSGNGIWTFGNFDPAHPEVQKISGVKTNNICMNLWNGKHKE